MCSSSTFSSSSDDEFSSSNCRLFFGNIPMDKTRDEIWKALISKGINNVTQVISYKAYSRSYTNRGYVFVEFSSREEAAKFRDCYKNRFKLWNKRIIIDWANNVIEPDEEQMKTVTKLFIRNLPVTMVRDEFVDVLSGVFKTLKKIAKIYKFKDYAFLHFRNKREAETALEQLKDYFEGSDVEVMWAKPPQRTPSLSPSNSTEELKFDELSSSRNYCTSESTSMNSLETDDLILFSPIPSESLSKSFTSTDQSFTEEENDIKCDYCQDEFILRKRYPLLSTESEWSLEFVINNLKVDLENKTLKVVLEEIDINYFNL